jgi:hypothetical protein
MVQSAEGTGWGQPPLSQEGATDQSRSAVCGQHHVPGIIAVQWLGGPRLAAGRPRAVGRSRSAGTAQGVATPLSAVARQWVGVSFGAMHRRHQALEHRVEELAGVFVITVGQQLQRAFEIGEQHRHLLALAFKGRFGLEDPLGKVGRGVAQRCMRAWGQKWGGRGSRLWGKRGPTFATELRLWLIHKPALGTRHPEGSTAFVTKLQAFRILKATARAVHG